MKVSYLKCFNIIVSTRRINHRTPSAPTKLARITKTFQIAFKSAHSTPEIEAITTKTLRTFIYIQKLYLI